MKKGEKVPDKIVVEYKGSEFTLQPGHKVWKMVIDEKTMTGTVSEAKLHKSRSLAFWKKPRYHVKSVPNVEYLPAFSIDKARIRFKKICKSTGLIVK